MLNILILNSRVREETKNSLVLVHQIIIGDGNIEVGNNELRVGVILDCVNNNFWTTNISTLLPTIFSYKTKKFRIILTQDLFEKRKKEVQSIYARCLIGFIKANGTNISALIYRTSFKE